MILKTSWADEKGQESSWTGRRLQRVAELRKSNFEVPQSQFRNFFLVRNSAIVLVVHNIAELRKCGLKLRMPTFGWCYLAARLTCGAANCLPRNSAAYSRWMLQTFAAILFSQFSTGNTKSWYVGASVNPTHLPLFLVRIRCNVTLQYGTLERA